MPASFALTLVVFFLSGLAALLYQVAWQRLLTIFSGADVYSATVIVAAFMAGMGLGNLCGGWVADRVSPKSSLVLCAAAEAAVGIFGALSVALYYDGLYGRLAPLGLGRGTVAVVLFLSLLWPTFFMGATLPLLARAMTDRLEQASFNVGALYGVNAAGAACGALVTTWVLLPRMGLDDALRLGAGVNLVCTALLIVVATGSAVADRSVPVITATPARSLWSVVDRRTATWMLIYACAGFIALSYEIVWFRLLGVIVKSTAFTFGTLLAVYLAGIGLGSLAGSRLASRSATPDRVFFALQAAAGIGGALLLALFVGAADDVRALTSYLAQYEPIDVRASINALGALEAPANFLRFYILVPVLLILPPTFIMGCSFPFVQRVVQRDDRAVGRHVALVLVANIVGSILGTVLTGGWLLTALGTAGTLQFLVAVSAMFVFFALRHRGGTTAWVGTLATLGVVAVLPSADVLWSRLHGTVPSDIVFAEDTTGLSVIRHGLTDSSDPTVVFVNGMGQSRLPYGDTHTALGALPVLAHPAPRDVAIIGLGSGDTLYAAASRPDTERITCIEIIGAQLPTLRALSRRSHYGGLHALLADPRISHRVGDGRAFLLRSRQRFDVIEADALRPTSAYSGNLYSEGYFTLVKDRLKPGGLATTWAPTSRIHDGFIKVFPYVISLPGMLIGSVDPISFDRELLDRRLADPRIRQYFARADIDIERLVSNFVPATIVRMDPTTDRSRLTDINTDLFPKDEFDLAPR